MKANLTKNTIILLSIGVVLLAVVQYFVYRDIKIKNQNISELSSEIDFQKNRENYILSTGKVMQNIDSDLKKVDASMVPASGDAAFLETLESMASKDGLDLAIDSLSIEDIGKSTTSPIVIFKIKAKTANGKWVGMYKFLKQVESMPVKVKVNSFSFMNTSASADFGKKAENQANWESLFEINVLKYK